MAVLTLKGKVQSFNYVINIYLYTSLFQKKLRAMRFSKFFSPTFVYNFPSQF